MNAAMARVARARQALGTPALDPGLMDQAVKGSFAPVSPISSWNSDVEFIQRRLPNRAAVQQGEAGREALGDAVPPAPATAQAAYSAPEMAQPLYQAAGRDRFSGYRQNPLDSLGRQRMLEQFIEAPLGGHVRRLLGDSQVAEQAAAGVLATGVGSWGLLSAIDALNGDSQTPGTMPIV